MKTIIDWTGTFANDYGRDDGLDQPTYGLYKHFRGDRHLERKAADLPDNWKTPVDYAGGKMYFRVEVLEKPNKNVKTCMLLRVTNGEDDTTKISYGYRTIMFTEPGVHYFEQGTQWAFPMLPDTAFDWEKPIHTMEIVVTDWQSHMIHPQYEQQVHLVHPKKHFWLFQAIGFFEGHPHVELFLPLKVRFTAIITGKGEEFTAPAWW